MPKILFAAGTKELCYRCKQPGDLRKCSRCEIARYCSSDCQRAHWKEHRTACVDHWTILSGDREDEADELKALLKWLHPWKAALLVWGMFAADLANQPPDFLLKNSCFVSLSRRPGNHSASTKYQVVWRGMRSDAEVLAEMQHIPHPEYRKQITDSFQYSMPPRADVLRITVAVAAQWVYCNIGGAVDDIFPDGQARLFTTTTRVDSRLLSTALVQAWSTKFAEYVNKGNTSGHTEILDDLRQTAVTVLDVD